MRPLGAVIAAWVLAGLICSSSVPSVTAQPPPPGGGEVKRADEKAAPAAADPAGKPTGAEPAGKPTGAATDTPDLTPAKLWRNVGAHPIWAGSLAVVAVLLVVGTGFLLSYASKSAVDPFIQQLGPSFFFWLGMGYLALLLLLAVAYNAFTGAEKLPLLVGGILPVAVPWFGALGAVTISVEGVFVWNGQWDKKYNYWHIGRPLFGAVLGIVAFFLFVLTVGASGTPPKFFDKPDEALAKDFIVFYIVAFLVGYREETFRELIKRATDLILQPSKQVTPAPSVTFRVAGTTPATVSVPAVAAPAASRVTVDVLNSGSAALAAPAVTVSPIAPTQAGTFAIANDHVTGGGDLAPGQARTLEVIFTPPAAGTFTGTLTVTATNLSAPQAIQVTGVGQ